MPISQHPRTRGLRTELGVVEHHRDAGPIASDVGTLLTLRMRVEQGDECVGALLFGCAMVRLAAACTPVSFEVGVNQREEGSCLNGREAAAKVRGAILTPEGERPAFSGPPTLRFESTPFVEHGVGGDLGQHLGTQPSQLLCRPSLGAGHE